MEKIKAAVKKRPKLWLAVGTIASLALAHQFGIVVAPEWITDLLQQILPLEGMIW